uniref:Uncharacterized protein n=1 Tax=Rhizophora mucronata TaxID=61149 RepID=A0A2P2R577_RHIMU
MNKNLRTSLP